MVTRMTQYLDTKERVNPNAANFSGAAATVMWVPPIYASAHLPVGRVGEPYVGAVKTSGGVLPFRFSIGGLPSRSGLAIDPDTGIIHGTPTRAFRSESVIIVVSDALGVASKVLNSLILEVLPPEQDVQGLP